MDPRRHPRTLAGALALSLVATAAPALADQNFYINAAPMAHERGAPAGPFWWAYFASSGSTGFFSTYGPYLRIGPWEGEIIALSYLELQPDYHTTLSADWDVYDGSQQIFLQRYSSYDVNKTFWPAAAFRTQPKDIQVRTRHLSGGNISQGDVRLLWESVDKVAQFWPAVEQLEMHDLGQPIGAGDWVSGPNLPGCGSSCPTNNYISYGPHSLPMLVDGSYVALFHVETNSGSGSSAHLFTLQVEVWDLAEGVYRMLASWPVLGSDLRGNNVSNALPLRFTVPRGMDTWFNFRLVRQHPTITIRQSGTKVFKVH
ncbi:MAG TPA: hypothetical protein VN914_03600 [Polyangia bacterium]|nr:hypothetical protein [Polyangia bacterium]